MTRVYTSPRHLGVERFVYRLTGVDPDADQRWTAYLRGVLSFSAVGVLSCPAAARTGELAAVARLSRR